MKNILSYKLGTKFSGQEILEWIEHQISNNTSHSKIARYLKKNYGGISESSFYTLYKGDYEVSQDRFLLRKV